MGNRQIITINGYVRGAYLRSSKFPIFFRDGMVINGKLISAETGIAGLASGLGIRL